MLDFENPPAPSRLRRAAADALGTFVLVFAGCGAIMVEVSQGGIGHTGVCAVFGLVVSAMIFTTGHLSGAHLNPAVTLAFASIGRLPWRDVLPYIVGQIAAAAAAAGLLRLLLGDHALMGATTFALPVATAFTIEVALTAILMFVITAVATDRRAAPGQAAVAIGATVALCALFGGPLTGASMNPARSLGPALVAGLTEGQWLYLVAPVLGAQLGAWAYVLLAFRR